MKFEAMSGIMPLIAFFARRLFLGSVARFITKVLERRFKMSPATANIVFLILTEVLARGIEKSGAFSKGGRFSKRA